MFRRRLVRGLAIILIVAAAVAALALLWGPLGAAGTFVVFIGDALSGADRLPSAAPLLWAAWGAVIGLFVGLFVVAERVGWQRRRRVLLALPICALLITAAVAHL